jgi:predicted ester cyclase
MSASSSPDRAEPYVRFYETMTQDSLSLLPDLVTHDVHFVDPFNDVRGVAALQRVMLKTLHDLPGHRFVVTHRAWDGDTCLMRWQFDAEAKGGLKLSFAGMSELAFAADGKVARHVDHWDAGKEFYEKLPLLGAVLRAIRRRVAA